MKIPHYNLSSCPSGKHQEEAATDQNTGVWQYEDVEFCKTPKKGRIHIPRTTQSRMPNGN